MKMKMKSWPRGADRNCKWAKRFLHVLHLRKCAFNKPHFFNVLKSTSSMSFRQPRSFTMLLCDIYIDAIACVQTCANQFWKALTLTDHESDSLQDALPSQQRFWRPLRRESASGALDISPTCDTWGRGRQSGGWWCRSDLGVLFIFAGGSSWIFPGSYAWKLPSRTTRFYKIYL